MKTSVVIYRELAGGQVRQDSKNQFMNANDIIDLYNTATGENKRLQDYLDNKQTTETKVAILREMQNNANSGEYENGVIKTKRGKNGGTWMHPLLAMDLGMWLSADFKVKIIKWFYDNVILFRNECGDGFKQVTDALLHRNKRTPPFEYSNEANMINKLVFGKIGKGFRNNASEEQLELLKQMQKVDVKLIEQGLDYYERYEELKKLKLLLQ